MKLLETLNQLGKDGKTVERLLSRMCDEDIFLRAYGKLSKNKGRLTRGTTDETIDGNSKDKMLEIMQTVQAGKYRWQPARRRYIAKTNGEKRPLGIPSWSDKLVQEVIRQCLEAYYEPQFRDSSHGFRPQRGCHTALMRIRKYWRGTNWFIEGDIKGCFDNIPHAVILNTLERRIKDKRFIKLIRNLLKSGYMENGKIHKTSNGVPQGGVLSPLLANIVLHELDEWVEDVLIPQHTKGKKPQVNKQYKRLTGRIYWAAKAGRMEDVKRMTKERRKLNSVAIEDPTFRRLRYIRYADDFILSYRGSYTEARAIKDAIRQKLAEMGLSLSNKKTLITNARKGRARFLGYEINISESQECRTVSSTRGKPTRQRTISGQVTLWMPKSVLHKWLAKYSKGNQLGKTAKPRLQLTHLTPFEIIATYQAEWRGVRNYYQLAINTGYLHHIEWMMYRSLQKTLGSKHRCSTRKIREKYQIGSRQLAVTITDSKTGKSYTSEFGGLPTRYQTAWNSPEAAKIDPRKLETIFQTPRTELEKRLLADTCELCGSHEDVEVHHIHSIKKLKQAQRHQTLTKWKEVMIARYRNTLVVCNACHEQIHNGKYDGRKF